MTRAGFEPTIPVFERSKAERASDGAATGTGLIKDPHYVKFVSKIRTISSLYKEMPHTQFAGVYIF